MKKKRRWLSLILFLLTFALLFAPVGASSLKQGSLSFFCRLFQNEDARAVFDLDEEEAVAVFGINSDAVFL